MTEESAWLIETKHLGAPAWWSRVDNEDDGVCGWSHDSLKAIRFVRAKDAQAIIDFYGWTEVVPTDHLWLDDAHKWEWFEKFKFTACEDCGIVQRADKKNGPCKGRVAVTLRVPSTEVTALVEAAREAVDTLDFSITLTHEVRPDLSAEVADTNQKYQDQANAAYSKLQAALVPFNGEKP